LFFGKNLEEQFSPKEIGVSMLAIHFTEVSKYLKQFSILILSVF